ncbi:MAG: T9SS type A sorting domain-containing protein [Chitinophagales bacterium]
MGKISIIILAVSLVSFGHRLNAQTMQIGKEVIIPDSFYVVHSGEGDNNIIQLSNIYLIRGTNDTVWIFGAGYGNKTPTGNPDNDIVYYGRTGPYREAIADARIVDTIIHDNFHLNKSKAKLMFITPHGHLDHINMEFISSLFDVIKYNREALAIFVDTGDYQLASCNQPYCGTQPHDMTNQFRGAPFDVAWTNTYLNKFVALGHLNDPCNAVVKTFTSVLGNCYVKKDRSIAAGGHTNGTVNLDNPTHEFRIEGAGAGNRCQHPNGWTIYHIHNDNLSEEMRAEMLFSEGNTEKEILLYPNPAHDEFSLLLADEESGLVDIYNKMGVRMTHFELFELATQKVNCNDWPRGLYFVMLKKNGGVVTEKIMVQ